MSDIEKQSGEDTSLSESQRQIFDWLMAMGLPSSEISIEAASGGVGPAMPQDTSAWSSTGLSPRPRLEPRPWGKVTLSSNERQLSRAAFLRKFGQLSG
ncbi:MAG: hypothetical protein Q8J78_09185 [Moraxellaceae bacterium]|nr:hypothetical protein [Moraxellaceae bacterium]